MKILNVIPDRAENNIANLPRAHNCLAFCDQLLAQIEQTKDEILGEFNDVLGTRGRLLRLALNEAEALAWQTRYPHLVFPTLGLEKAQAVSAWHERQQRLFRSASLAQLAA